MTVTLFSPLAMGDAKLGHRVVLAPLTRMRATQPGNVPGPLNAEYYGQRASKGGMLIAEATQVMPEGQGYPHTPGIHTDAQEAGWKLVTDAVHAKGGLIYLQLWHVGRISHSSHQPGGKLPVGPSAIAANAKAMTAEWKTVPFEAPRALEDAEIPGIVAAFRAGAARAIRAGFDGVEIHGANGYLLEQFLQTHSNQRTGPYGGSLENRMRLHLEVTDAVVAEVGAGRTGIRLSPWGIANDSHDDDPATTYSALIKELAKRNLAFLHVIEPRASGIARGASDRVETPSSVSLARPLWPNVLIGAGGYERDSALEEVASGRADAVAFGRHFIANPDLPHRLERDIALTPYDRSTFYGGDAHGYTDYPFA